MIKEKFTKIIAKCQKKINNYIALWSLGADLKSKFLLVFADVFLSFQRFLKEKKIKISFNLRINDDKYRITLKDEIEFWQFKEIFVQKIYDIGTNVTPKTIVDLGSNIGLSVLFFRSRYPMAKIYAYEPDPENFKRLIEHTKKIPNLYLYPCAVSDHTGETVFYVSCKRKDSSSILKRETEAEKIKVRSCRIIDIEKMVGVIDLLKFDIEGAEKMVFSMLNKDSKIMNVIGEVHCHLISSLEDFISYFINSSFELVLPDQLSQKFILKGSKKRNSN